MSSSPCWAPLLLVFLTFGLAAPAGSLDPTGAPASTPGPEPRIAINAANTPGDSNSLFRIAQPGSYYLEGNLAGVVNRHGIEIASSNVTLDLMGYSLLGVPGSRTGIVTDGARGNLTIRNGHVAKWGEGGIDLAPELPTANSNVLLHDLTATSNVGVGFRAGNNAVVRDCIAHANGGTGIIVRNQGVVSQCVASSNGSSGIDVGSGVTLSNCSTVSNVLSGIVTLRGCTIIGCSSSTNGGNGISAGAACLIANCNGDRNLMNGISAAIGSSVISCRVAANHVHGIAVTSDCIVRDCGSDSNGVGTTGAGILVTGGDCHIDNNACTDNGWGIRVTSNSNILTRNVCSGNTTLNWDVVAGNRLLVVDAAPAGAVSGNAGGAALGSTEPNANYTY